MPKNNNTHIISHKVENIIFIFIIGEFYREKTEIFLRQKKLLTIVEEENAQAVNILETQFYYISTASRVKVKRNRAALPCIHIYICISEWRNIKKFSAKKSTHKKSEVEGKRTHQESRYGFDVEKRKKKGRRELDEPLSSKTSKKTEREKKEVKQEKCRSEYRKKSKFLIRREENIYS